MMFYKNIVFVLYCMALRLFHLLLLPGFWPDVVKGQGSPLVQRDTLPAAACTLPASPSAVF